MRVVKRSARRVKRAAKKTGRVFKKVERLAVNHWLGSRQLKRGGS